MENTSRKYWEQKISEWRSGGLNIRDWCQKSDTDVKQFYTWKNRLDDSKSEETVFAEVTAHYQLGRQANRIPSQDTRPMLYYQGIKLYIPDPFNDDCVFLFCNKRKNSLKVLRYYKTGFILAGKTVR